MAKPADHRRLVCFDPGGTTGVAIFVDCALVWWGTITDPGEVARLIEPGDLVLYEAAIWRTPAFNPVGLETIGVIKHYCQLRGAEAVSRSPGVLKGVRQWPTINLHAAKSQHSRDAIGHGITYLGLDTVKLPPEFVR